MFFSILGLLTGLAGPLAQITGKITDLKLAQVQAKSNTERAEIDQRIEEAHDRKAILVAEAGQRIAGTINASMRFILALGPAVLLSKIFVWDKVMGSFYGCAGNQGQLDPSCNVFRTDPLDPYLWGVVTAVIAFYFAYDMMMKRR